MLAQGGDVRHVHDPCIIKHGPSFCVLSTGTRFGETIPIRRSNDLRTWQRTGFVFSTLPAWIKEQVPGVRSLWAPDVAHFRGQYHLYYSASTFGSQRSAIGLVTNVTLDPASPDYRWVDRGPVITSKPGDDFNAIDPNFILDDAGQPWLSFGSFWNGIMLIRLERSSGKRPEGDDRVHALARRPNRAIEAPFLHRHADWYYLFVSFDQCCRGSESTYRIVVGRSNQIVGPYLDRDGVPMLQGGGTPVLGRYGRFRGPGHNAILSANGTDWLVHHFYDADAKGVATLQIRHLTWDRDGWPIAGEPLTLPDGTPPSQ
jgi:arabinan endo-1,5-alpha-L-arabinosidase